MGERKANRVRHSGEHDDKGEEDTRALVASLKGLSKNKTNLLKENQCRSLGRRAEDRDQGDDDPSEHDEDAVHLPKGIPATHEDEEKQRAISGSGNDTSFLRGKRRR